MGHSGKWFIPVMVFLKMSFREMYLLKISYSSNGFAIRLSRNFIKLFFAGIFFFRMWVSLYNVIESFLWEKFSVVMPGVSPKNASFQEIYFRKMGYSGNGFPRNVFPDNVIESSFRKIGNYSDFLANVFLKSESL